MTTPNQPPTITLGGRTATLVAPDPFAACALARTSAELQADPALYLGLSAAALRECWPESVAWPCPQMPRRWAPGKRLEVQGRDVFNGLIQGGVKAGEVISAAGAAWRWALASQVSAEEMEAARGNSEGPEGA